MTPTNHDVRVVLMTSLCVMTQVVTSDVLQKYTLHNAKQCQRLCWYRAPCSVYTVRTDVILDDVNCVLQMDPVSDGYRSDGWLTSNSSATGIHNGCRNRPCADTKVCVPAGGGQHTCLDLYLNCRETSTSRRNATMQFDRMTPGHEATLTCDPGFLLTPLETVTPVTKTCKVKGRWSRVPDGITCHQVQFSNPAVPSIMQLAEPLKVGWTACIRGTMTGYQMNFNFMTQDDKQSQDFTLHVAFRNVFRRFSHSAIFNQRQNGVWGAERLRVRDMPLNPGDPFVLTFNLTDTHLTASLHNMTFSASYAWPGQADLLSVVQLFITNTVTLDYVDTASSQDCVPAL